MKILACFVLIFVCRLAERSSAVDLASGHSFFAALDESQKVKLYWNVDTAKKEISFTVEAQTTGWIGFGISSGQGKMAGADIVIGWVKDGKPYFKDRHATGHSTPQIDSQQDYELISLQEDSGKTIMKFKRKFQTCDPDDNKIQEGTTKLIYAFHPHDPSSEDSIPWHDIKSMGAKSVFLLNSVENVTKLPNGSKSFDFVMNKTSVPTNRTTYYYRVFEFPKLLGRHDIIQIDPIIQEGNEGVIHHMILYECKDDFPRSNLSFEGTLDSPDMPPAVTECAGGHSVIAGWAIGRQSLYYPEHVGFSIGTDDSPKFAVFEMHYDNYDGKAGINDSSGLRFHYTSELREYQSGVLTVGWSVSPYMVIPPNQVNWETEGYCVGDCTSEGLKGSTLKDGGIRIFASTLHTHLAGRAAHTRHIRKGIELPEIIRDDHYDFNFQEIQVAPKEITVLPGDSLITVCKYRTGDSMITGGLGTDQELCLSYHLYYPKANLTKCWSNQRLGYEKFETAHGRPNLTWNDKLVSALRKSYQDTEQIYVSCSGRNSAPLPGLGRTMLSKPAIDSPLKRESECEEVTGTSGKLASYSLVVFVQVLFGLLFSCIS